MVGTRPKYRGELKGGGEGKEMKRQRVIKIERRRLGEIEEEGRHNAVRDRGRRRREKTQRDAKSEE